MPRQRLLPLTAATMSALLCLLTFGAPVTAQEQASASPPPAGRVTVYTSVTQDTVDAVRAALAAVAPELEVEVFRAPTGELDARIASELRTGGVGADVLWLTDPLSMERYQEDGLLAPLTPAVSAAVPGAYQGQTFVGTRLLNLVFVAGADVVDAPGSWADLAEAQGVVIPDPGFAGSAFAALGYLGTTDDYGMGYFSSLKDHGAVVVSSPVDVVNGVAEGIYQVGVTLDQIGRSTMEKGAPVQLIWPEPGAIALYSPAAVLADSEDEEAAAAFLEFLVSADGQAAIAATGWQPVRDDVPWPYAGPVVTADWDELYGRQAELLAGFDAIFGD